MPTMLAAIAPSAPNRDVFQSRAAHTIKGVFQQHPSFAQRITGDSSLDPTKPRMAARRIAVTMHLMRLRSVETSVGIAMLLLAVSAYGQSAAQIDEVTRTKMDAAIRRCLLQDGTPSASVAVVRGDHIVYVAAFGDAVLQPRLPASQTTRYQLASISKTFTAQAILLLEAEGRLSLDDKVSRWYPGLTDAAVVSVRELLNHTSGYPDHYPETYPAGPKREAVEPDQIIEAWGKHPLLFAPGTQYRYSNLEYEIAGRIAEKVSGKSLFQFMQERIFKPLQMNATMDLDTIPDGSKALATGYVELGLAPLEPAAYEGPGWSFGSGQIVTTATDVALWDTAFLQHELLPQRQAAEEISPAHLPNHTTYPSALGLFVSHDGGVTRFYHTGEGLGFEAVNMIYPDALLAVVVLTNTNVKPTCLKIADALTYLLLPPTEEDIFARTVFSELQSGRPDLAGFSDDLKQYLSPARLSEYRSSLSPLGPVQAFSLARAQTVDGLTTRDYDVNAGGHSLRLHMLLLPNQQLEDVTISAAQ